MEFLPADAVTNERWDAFVAAADGAWFWHGTSWRDYTLAYRPALDSRSLAFLVRDAGCDVAAVPLMLERHPDGHLRMTFGGDACWSPALLHGLGARHRDAVLRSAFHWAADLADEHHAVSLSWRVSPLAAELRGYVCAFLAASTRSGCIDESLCSQVIDLDVSPERLHADMRKGHRADVTRALRCLDVDVLDAGTCTDSDFDAYRAMHAAAAGRVTRPDSTFELMRYWITEGHALLLRCRRGGEALGFTYLIIDRDGAYYASAANQPGAEEPIGHVLQSAAMDALRDRGVKRYELGIQQYGPLPHDIPEPKALAISAFKRGFGGYPVPLLVRTQWFDTGLASRELGDRVNRWVIASSR